MVLVIVVSIDRLEMGQPDNAQAEAREIYMLLPSEHRDAALVTFPGVRVEVVVRRLVSNKLPASCDGKGVSSTWI